MNRSRSWLTRLNDLPVKSKLILLILISAIGIVSIAVTAARLQYLDVNSTRETALRIRIELAKSVFDYYRQEAETGKISVQDAKQQALTALGSMHTEDGDNYYYVLNDKATMLMHPVNRDLVGKNLDDYRLESGERLFHDQVQAAKTGTGFTTYSWPKPGHGDKPVLKKTYSKFYPEWNWVVATGIYMDDVQSQAWRFTGLMTLAGGILIILLLGISWFIGDRIVKPLQRATATAKAIAGGNLSNTLEQTSNDECGQLLGSMRVMQDRILAVLAALTEMARQHDAGTVSYLMDESAFPGEYGVMVRDTNALVDSHVKAILGALAIMKRYSVGDLSIDIDRLPGEKAVMHETVDAVKASLLGISNEINHLAAAAANGDFSQRGNETHYQFVFHDIVTSFNRLMTTAESNLHQVSGVLKAIAEGDLTARMEGDFHGVFAQMRDDANATVAQLTNIVTGIQQAADHINSGASEIASGNDDLSRRTEQQAASLEETAASMEELTSTVRQNAENARKANQQAQTAAQVAAHGGSVVNQVVTTMHDIESSSKKIADIISVIDGIAFQTNILALNAAVEAARAGEQGRGFAVVASEVRALAQRSATAAKEIKQLIEESVDKVAGGSQLVQQAGNTMSEIVASV